MIVLAQDFRGISEHIIAIQMLCFGLFCSKSTGLTNPKNTLNEYN